MDLGRIGIRGQNVDIIHQALHPRHGFVWTDSKAIYLSPIQVVAGSLDHQEKHKLGEFENTVKSVHWSSDIGPQTCYMCVVLPQHVSIWKVDGSVPKLTFKQVRKLNVQPIPQGCLWNPGRDILCILSKQQCNFFFRHTHNRGSYAFPPLESGKISCGTWSDDGTKLVLCVGAIILLYSWPEIDVSISNFTPAARRIPQLDGTVRAIKALSADMVVCAAELPLESLCKDQDSFSIPDSSGITLDGSDDSLMIVPRKKQQSVKDTLLNLPRNPETLIQDSSQLITVHLREGRDPQKRSSVGVAGMLTPELLVYDPLCKVVIIGSNTQNVLQVFSFDGDLKGKLVKITEVVLEQNERPKGLACLSPSVTMGHKGILVAMATKSPGDVAFLSSPGMTSHVHLQFFPLHIPDFPKSQSSGKLNGSVDSTETGSVSSVDSPRHKIKVLNSDMEDSAQSSPRDLNLSTDTDQSESVSEGGETQAKPDLKEVSEGENSQQASEKMEGNSQQASDKMEDYSQQASSTTEGNSQPSSDKKDENSQQSSDKMDIQLTKQSTVTQLCDQSDVDSESSPREITLSTETQSTERASIVDLSKGTGDNDSDLETETVDFSQQKPNFASNDFTESAPDQIDPDYVHKLEEKLSSKSGSSNPSSHHSSEQRSRPTSQGTESLVSLVDSSSQCSRRESEDPYISKERSRLSSQSVELSLPEVSQADYMQQEDIEKLSALEEELAAQNNQITALQQKISLLSRAVEETSVIFPTRYQLQEKPETIQVVCRYGGTKTSRKQFLLDNGRLQLQPVKKAFSLSTVELFLDGEPCVVGCNIDGYIPMRFQPSTTLIITGLSSTISSDPVKHPSDTDSEEEHGIEDYENGATPDTVC